MTSVEELQARFGIAGALTFEVDARGGAVARIATGAATAMIALRGAQLLGWQPAGHAPVLWCSPLGRLDGDRPLRGGIPVCWPWFGAHPADPAAPAHGIARTLPWQVVEAGLSADEDGAVHLTLALDPTGSAGAPGPVTLRLAIGRALHLELSTTSTSRQPVALSEALHTYLAVADVAAVHVEGLDGRTYLDKVQDFRRLSQEGDVRFAGEVDRIYLDTAATRLVDPGLGRVITIDPLGTSRSTVVWNPGPEVAARMPDMPPGGYRGMVCVETAHAADDAVMLAPGATSILAARITVAAMAAHPRAAQPPG